LQNRQKLTTIYNLTFNSIQKVTKQNQKINYTMSLVNSVPHVLDPTGTYQPIALFDPTREDLTTLNEDRYHEDESKVRFILDAPTGLMPQKTKVAVQQGKLMVAGERHEVSDDGTAETHEDFKKVISLGNEDGLDLPKIGATLYGHTIVVEIPKKTDTES
jgi:hypothetical protein